MAPQVEESPMRHRIAPLPVARRLGSSPFGDPAGP
jgi:hypothetical protein